MKHIYILLFPLLCLMTLSLAYAATAVPITVTMSEPVNVTGCPANCPRITLDVGGVTRYADFSAGSGTATLTFTYTTQAGDVDLDGITITSNTIDLNTSGTVKDLNGNNLSPLTFTIPNTSTVKVNHPSLSMDFVGSDYILNGTHYATLPLFLSAATGTFTRASIGTYFDSSGVMQTATAGTPRFDHNPVTHAAKGLLIEDARTNGTRNGNASGSVTGTPGTLPTNFGIGGGGLGTLTQQIVGSGTENGVPYFDFKISGTASNSSFYLYMDSATAIPAASGQIWTTSMYSKLAAGSLTNLSIQYGIYERNSVGGALTLGTTVISPSATLTRYKFTRTLANASTAYIIPFIQVNLTAGLSVNMTLRLGGIQIEQGNFQTSYIPTTSGAVSRQADVLTIPTGVWYNQAAGTVSENVAWETSTGTAYPKLWQFDDTTGNNRWNTWVYQGTPSLGFDTITGGVNQGGASVATSFIGSAKNAAAQATNNTRTSFNGTLNSLDSTYSVPTVTQLKFYEYNLNKWISDFKYYPARVADTQLQLLTQ